MRNKLLFSIALGLSVTTHATASKVSNYANLSAATAYSSGRVIQNTVEGTVSDNNGVIVGATVSVIGTPGAVKTNTNGKFKITAPIGSTLRFSSVGYTSKDVKVVSSTVNVTLEVEDNPLEEVVVVGYGTQKKGNLTGAVSSINVKDNLEGRPIADVGRAIQGTTPGLSVTVPSGEVGSDPTMRIRGAISSVQGNSGPLILLDNVEIPSIQYVNPDDVESITVLKDAAASSIYGAKAAFGVVLITSKVGSKSDKVIVNYSNNFSFQNPSKKFEMAGVNGLRYIVDAIERVGTADVGAFYRYNRDVYEGALEWQKNYGSTIGKNDPTVYGRDWIVDPTNPARKWSFRIYDPYDYMVREWAPSMTHNASLNGNTGKTKYTASVGYLGQSGMMKPGNKDKFQRFNSSLRLSTELTDNITLRGGAMFSQRVKTYPYVTAPANADPWLYMYRWGSVYPMGYDEHGQPIRSPWSEAEAANESQIKKNYINLNVGTTIKLKSNWNVEMDYNFTNEDYTWPRNGTRFTAADSWSSPVKRNDANGNPVFVNRQGQVVPESDPDAIRAYDLNYYQYTSPGTGTDHIYLRSENSNRHTFNAFTTYNLNLNEGHEFKFMAGTNIVADKEIYHWSNKTNLLDITNPQFDLAIGTQTSGGGESWKSQLGFFGRVNYAYKNKYLFEANLRRDGSSSFPTHLRWRWFPSMSAGWVVTEESFMDWSKSVLTHLKFRGSYGVIGNQNVRSDLYISNMSAGESSWIANSAKVVSVGSPKLNYPNATWEDLEQLNIGVDARFFGNKLGVVFDWYQKNTNNLFAPQEGTTWTLGAPAPLGNFGTLTTKGFELAVDYNHKFENGLGINLRANIDDAVSRFYNYTNSRLTSANYDGKQYGEIWGYETDRLYQYDDFVLGSNGKPQLVTLTPEMSKYNTSGGGKVYLLKDGPNGEAPIYQSRFQNSSGFFFGPGDVKFKDLNGDGEIDNGNGTIDNPGDMKRIGNSTPRYSYGFRVGADYKGFDFSVFFQGVGSREVWGAGFLAIPGFNVGDGAMPAAFADDYWRDDNQGAFYPAAFNNAGSANVNNMQVQSKYLLDMSYLRMKNITLGYSIPKMVLDRAKINNLRVYVALENFFTWDKLNGLPIDPEEVAGTSIFNETNYNSGRTGVGTPTFKSASFGLQLTF